MLIYNLVTTQKNDSLPHLPQNSDWCLSSRKIPNLIIYVKLRIYKHLKKLYQTYFDNVHFLVKYVKTLMCHKVFIQSVFLNLMTF